MNKLKHQPCSPESSFVRTNELLDDGCLCRKVARHMVEFRTNAEEVLETFLLTSILTAMGTAGGVLSCIDPEQVCGLRDSPSHCFHEVAHYRV